MKKGIVYCLTNPAMPELVKIGRVEESTPGALKRRMRTLYSTSVPAPFELHYAVVVGNAEGVEKLLHEAFGESRENPKREFVRVGAERVVAAMKLTRGKEVSIRDIIDGDPKTPVSQPGLYAQKGLRKRKTKIRPKFKFSDADIEPGARLTFAKDRSITAVVIGDSKIKYAGEETTLSGSARKILASKGFNTTDVAGTHHWEYEGEVLDAIRKRKEAESETEE